LPSLPPALNSTPNADDRTGDRTALIKALLANTAIPCDPSISRIDSAAFGDGNDYLLSEGFYRPFIVAGKQGAGKGTGKAPNNNPFGLLVPPPSFSISDLADVLSPQFPVTCIDTRYQTPQPHITNLGEWVDYMDEERPRGVVNNLISLEYSNTAVEDRVKPPSVVTNISVFHKSWPRDRKGKGKGSCAPYVHNYCLSSPEGSYCDFHADFGGSSVFYHVHTGSKTFYLLPPEKQVLEKYELWLVMPNQSDVFFPDLLEPSYCTKITVNQGETFFIPSGYIHAVYTPVDSLVFGGNFLTPYCIETQLAISSIEARNLVPEEYRFPFFKQAQFYMAATLLQRLRLSDANPACTASEDGEDLVPLSLHEQLGVPALVTALRAWVSSEEPPATAEAAQAGGGFNSVQECATDAAMRCGHSRARDLVDELELRSKGEWTGVLPSSPPPKKAAGKFQLKLTAAKPAKPPKPEIIYKEDMHSDEEEEEKDDSDEEEFGEEDAKEVEEAEVEEERELNEQVRKAAQEYSDDEAAEMDWADEDEDDDVVGGEEGGGRKERKRRAPGEPKEEKKPEKKKMVINLSLKSRAAAAAAVKEEEEEEGEPKKKLMLVPKKKPEKIPEKKVVAVKKQIDGKAKLLKKLQGFR
jgi:hypothetical protein